MSDERVKKVDLPASEEGLEIQFGEHTVGWYKHAAWFAAQMFDSRTLPGHIQTAQQAFAILCKGDELGLKPWASWSFIYPTKQGRLALMTKGALAVVQSKPTFAGYEERIENEGKPEMRAVAIATRKGFPPVIKEFSLEDAKLAKLLDQRYNRSGEKYDSTYQSFLKDMLLSRARGRCLDIAFAAELGGIPIEGVAEDADMMAAREAGTAPKPAAAPPRRDPLLAAVGQKQLVAGTVTSALEQQVLGMTAVPGNVPRDTVLFVNKQGQEVGRIAGLAEPGEPPIRDAHGDVLDPALVQIIADQVDEVYGPPQGAAEPQAARAAQAVPEPSQPAGPPVVAHQVVQPSPPAAKVSARERSKAPTASPPVAAGEPTRPAVEGPSLGVAKALGRPSICQRCNARLNEMGGCDVCGWPGKDIR